MASIQERVIDVVFKQFECPSLRKSEIVRETKFKADLGADSLDATELALELEEEFDVDIPDDASDKFLTVGDVVDYLSSLPCVAA